MNVKRSNVKGEGRAKGDGVEQCGVICEERRIKCKMIDKKAWRGSE